MRLYHVPSEDEKAHDKRTECSDGGLCNRETGQCECGGLFHGAACEYMICPGGITDACNGHGRYTLGIGAIVVDCRIATRSCRNCNNSGSILSGRYQIVRVAERQSVSGLLSRVGAFADVRSIPIGGRCMTMAELALAAESNGDATDYTYGEDPNEGSTWDAHRIHG